MEKKGVLVPMLLAMGAAVFYLMVLSSKESALRGAYETAKVLSARVDIPERTVLKEDMVEVLEVPRKFMQQDSFEIKTQGDMKLIVNLVTRNRVPKGNQLTQSSLISLSPESGLSVKIPPGYRGAILPIDQEMKILIKPGDRVDVLVTFDALMNDGRKEKVTATILQNVLVIAVGTNLGQGMNARQFKNLGDKEDKTAAFSEKASVSLALNPNEAQYLALAIKQGDTTVIMRGLGDAEMHPMEMASFRKLFR
ncbi:MAG: Flp pilus assembly protein CpaB [Elusimicrobia bacterium]|jgi:pilus assembly protein CpaB|nr:Flp pilus assembly protein CpaB [Elusimicrobiota bacterium]